MILLKPMVKELLIQKSENIMTPVSSKIKQRTEFLKIKKTYDLKVKCRMHHHHDPRRVGDPRHRRHRQQIN